MTSDGHATTRTQTDSGPSGYAAARLRLLTRGGAVRAAAPCRPGRPHRRLARRRCSPAGAEAGAGRRRWSPSAATAAASSPRAATSTCCCCTTARDARRVAALADRLWYPVWDLGLALDHSVRTPAEARKTAGEDLKVQLGLLDARHIAGDLGLTAGLRTAVLADWRNQAPKRLPELHELCAGAGRAPGRAAVPARTRPQGGPRRTARRHRAARRRRLLARRRARARASPRPAAGCSTPATRSTWPPAAPPTGSRSRNRTRSPPTSACSTPTPCCARSTRPRAPSPTPPTSPGAR